MIDEGSYPTRAGRAGRRRARRTPLPTGSSKRVHIGDIAISVERAIEQAETGRGGQTGDVRWSPADELRLLVTHGTLTCVAGDIARPRGGRPCGDSNSRLPPAGQLRKGLRPLQAETSRFQRRRALSAPGRDGE